VLRLDPRLAPVKVAVLPLSRKRRPLAQGRDLAAALRKRWNTDFDDASAIGRRYRRQDEIGTPYCVTIDFDTLNDKAVTVRDRDTMNQERVGIDNVRPTCPSASALAELRAGRQGPRPSRPRHRAAHAGRSRPQPGESLRQPRRGHARGDFLHLRHPAPALLAADPRPGRAFLEARLDRPHSASSTSPRPAPGPSPGPPAAAPPTPWSTTHTPSSPPKPPQRPRPRPRPAPARPGPVPAPASPARPPGSGRPLARLPDCRRIARVSPRRAGRTVEPDEPRCHRGVPMIPPST